MALVSCPECGQPVSEYADACPHCGIPLSPTPLQTSSTPPPQLPDSPDRSLPSQPGKTYYYQPTPPRGGGGSNKWWLIVPVALLAAVAGYFGYQWLEAKQARSKMEEQAHIDSIAHVREIDNQQAIDMAVNKKLDSLKVAEERQRRAMQSLSHDGPYRLTGSVGSKQVEMVLYVNGDYVNGNYCYVNSSGKALSSNLDLVGYLDEYRNVELTETNYNGDVTGYFSLRRNLSGSFVNYKDQTFSVSLVID